MSSPPSLCSATALIAFAIAASTQGKVAILGPCQFDSRRVSSRLLVSILKLLHQSLWGRISVSTIRKVAQNAGVSIATVSRVINNNPAVSDAIREKVLDAINACNYVPAVSRRSTSFLALVYASSFSLGSSYDMALIEGMGQAMDAVDFDLVVLNPSRDRGSDETYTQYFLRKGVRGVILRSTTEGRSVCEEIAEEKFPAIVVGDHFEHPSLNFVYADSYPTSKQATQHLLTLGHRRIAFASNKFDDGDHADRHRGYAEAMQESGVNVGTELIFRVPAHRPDGAQLLRNLMSAAEPPTAVFITDPSVAVGLLNEARSMNVEVPRDLSVVGFDDRDARDYIHPKMTAVCQDAVQLGREAFLQLAKIVETGGEKPQADVVSQTWLELNQTTGPAPAEVMRVMPDGTRLVASP